MFNSKVFPMLLKEVDKPFNDEKYIYELKFDGIRAIIHVSNKNFLIISRHGVDITKQFPELENIKDLVGNKKVIFDGEIVAFDKGVPSFSKLQLRSHLKNVNKIKDLINKVPVAFVVFDILYLDRDITKIKLIDRKKYLNKYDDTEYFIKSKVYYDGISLFQKVKELNLEGIVAKEKNSIYIPNKRVDFWLKIKNFKVEEFLIHGFIKNKEKYSLLLGEYRNNKLYYIGKVSVIDKNEILKIVKVSKKTNNKFVNYDKIGLFVEPVNKIKVHYIERTDTNMLRQPFIKNNKAKY